MAGSRVSPATCGSIAPIWCRGNQPQADPITHTEVADWLITGGLRCSSFGMPADRAFISERVALQALGRIELET
jgi:hypothetical protein